MFGTSMSLAKMSTQDFAGRWYVCDDGWLGTLTLDVVGEHDLAGTFASARFDEDYRVTAQAGTAADPHGIELDIHDFNWMSAQHYVGHLFTRSHGMIAGFSKWKDVPFGFFATRGTRRALSTYRPGTVRGDDFAGSWTAYLDGESVTIVTDFDRESGVLHGSCTGASGEYEVIGQPGQVVPHGISLTLRIPDNGPVAASLSGYLMSRPKNAISGTMIIAEAAFGFVMIRYA